MEPLPTLGLRKGNARANIQCPGVNFRIAIPKAMSVTIKPPSRIIRRISMPDRVAFMAPKPTLRSTTSFARISRRPLRPATSLSKTCNIVLEARNIALEGFDISPDLAQFFAGREIRHAPFEILDIALCGKAPFRYIQEHGHARLRLRLGDAGLGQTLDERIGVQHIRTHGDISAYSITGVSW